MRRRFFELSILCLLVTVAATAQDTAVFVPDQAQPIQQLQDHLEILKDPGKNFTINDIIRNANGFRKFSDQIKFDEHAVYWIRLRMRPIFRSNSFYIGLPNQNLPGMTQGNDIASVWIFEGDSLQKHYEAGNLEPLSRRIIKDPINHNLFPVSLEENKLQTIYCRLERTVNFIPLQFNFALQHATIVTAARNPMDRLAWFYTGIMFILFIFGLVFFLITRDRPFIWFACIAALLCIHMQLLEPENKLTRWLFPEHPIYQFHLFTLLTAAFSVGILQFIRSFVKTKSILPRWDKIILGMMGFMTLVTIIALALLAATPASAMPVGVYLLAFIGYIIISIRLVFTKDLFAKWAGVALLWLFFFQFLGMLWNNDVLPYWFPNPWIIAQIGMMIILFFSLAYRFKVAEEEKAEAAKIRELDAIKSRFFANISHEFRTPLTLMLGPLKQIEESDNPILKKQTSMMRRNGERLLQLINQLLDLSRLESGKMQLHVTPTNIGGLFRALASGFDILAEERQINFQVHLTSEEINGYCDSDKLEKILVNLLSNAFRYTGPNGTVSLSVEADDKRLRFVVQDSGSGMGKDQLDKIFDRFYQVTGTEGGTGIGLSLVKELLQLHKGQVSVQSEAGKGSSFRISLPISREAYLPSEIGNQSSAIEAEAVSSNAAIETVIEDEEPMTDSSLPLVLIAEDNKDMQQYISDVLTSRFRIELANDGRMALERCKELVPDCVVSDVMMPEMDGIEFCQQLKSDPATSHIPVILLTAKAGHNSKIEGLRTGADDYLVKPFDAAELEVRIQNLIEQRQKLRDTYSQQVISLQPEQVMGDSMQTEFLNRIRELLEENIDNELFGVSELAEAIHLSRSQLHRKLRTMTGLAPNVLIRNFRLERALQLLQNGSSTIGEIAFQTGFSSAAYFSKCFLDRYGKVPGDMRGNKISNNT